MFSPLIRKNDKKYKTIIYLISFVVFGVVVFLDRISIDVKLGFDPRIFAGINALINTAVTILLIAGFFAIKSRQYKFHRTMMFLAMTGSFLFLVSYVLHHIFTDSVSFGGEGFIRYIYYFILITHIFLAAVILPFILFTTYRALTSDWPAHKKIARITWPIWLYVSVTGVLVYLLISPYY
jgi:putative membrane protein